MLSSSGDKANAFYSGRTDDQFGKVDQFGIRVHRVVALAMPSMVLYPKATVQEILMFFKQLGVDPNGYSGHSFRKPSCPVESLLSLPVAMTRLCGQLG